MGEAKRRGTFKERQERAIEVNEKKERERREVKERFEAERLAAMTPEEKERLYKMRQLLVTAMGIGSSRRSNFRGRR